MTTIKITDGHDPDEGSEVNVSVHLKYEPKPGEFRPPPSSPILLSAHDGPGYEAAGVWLSPSKAREVIAALQAAVDEVDPGGVSLAAAVAELVDFAEGVAVGHDVPVFFRNEARNVARHRAVLPPRER